jgi:hypothetical protein
VLVNQQQAAAGAASTVADTPPPDGYKIGWNPGSKTFYVQLKETGKKIKENFQSRIEALAFAKDHKLRSESVGGVVPQQQRQKVA